MRTVTRNTETSHEPEQIAIEGTTQADGTLLLD